jgi:hypothetical protein
MRLRPEALGVSVRRGKAWPNNRMQVTANSVRSCLAPAARRT